MAYFLSEEDDGNVLETLRQACLQRDISKLDEICHSMTQFHHELVKKTDVLKRWQEEVDEVPFCIFFDFFDFCVLIYFIANYQLPIYRKDIRFYTS